MSTKDSFSGMPQGTEKNEENGIREATVQLDPRADGAESEKQAKRLVAESAHRAATKEQRQEPRRHSRAFPM